MTDPDFEPSNERERALWTETLVQLREHAEDPRADEGLEVLGGQILRARRSDSSARTWSKRGLVFVGLAAAAVIAVLVLPRNSEDGPPAVIAGTPEAPVVTEAVRPLIRGRGALGPPADPSAVLTFRAGRIEQVTEVAVDVQPGMAIEPGATLSTPTRGETCLRWTQPFGLVCIEGGASVELVPTSEPATRRLRLAAGRLVAVLDPLAPGQRFEIETSLGTVTAIGTVFVVDVREVSIGVSVFEGIVEVREPTRVTQLHADEFMALGGSVVGSLDGAVRDRAQIVSARAELWREPLARLGFVDIAPTREPIELDGHRLSAGPIALLLTDGQHHLSAGNRTSLDLEVVATERQSVSLSSGPAASPKAKVHSAAELARLAQEHRTARNYAETARLYRELLDRYPESPEATNVPVRLGDLLMTTGEFEPALAAYDLYIERGGQLAPEARFGRIRALRGLGRNDDEKAAIDVFLDEHPDDYRCQELSSRRAEL